MPAGDGSPLGSPAWLLVPRLTFMVPVRQVCSMSSGTSGDGCSGVAIVQAAGVGDLAVLPDLRGEAEDTSPADAPTRGTGCAGHRPADDGSRLAGGAGGFDDDPGDDAGVGDQGQVAGVDP